MRIEDVSDRMVFKSILGKYGLQANFVRQRGSTSLFAGVVIYGGRSMDHVASLSTSEFKSTGFDDLLELCEYWKMLAVFR